MIKRADWLLITKDRTAVVLGVVLVLWVVVVIATTMLRLHYSDIQVPVRYSGYGQNSIYRDQWYTQLAFAGFGVVLTTINVFLATKVYQLRRMLGLGFLAMSIFIALLTIIVSNAVFNLSQSL